MRLAEFDQPSAEQQRVKRQKETAKVAKDRAKQLDALATASADQMKARQSMLKLKKSRAPSSTGTIKPHA